MSVILLYSSSAILARERLEALRRDWAYTPQEALRVEAESFTPALLRSLYHGEALFLPQIRVEVKNAAEIIRLPLDSLLELKDLLKETPEDALVLFYQEGELESASKREATPAILPRGKEDAGEEAVSSRDAEDVEEAIQSGASSPDKEATEVEAPRPKKVKGETKEKKPKSFLEYFKGMPEVRKILLEPPKWDGLKTWTVQRAKKKGLSLPLSLVPSFLGRVGERLDDIEQALNILSLLKRDDPRVAPEDIEQLPESPEANIYKMMDSLWQGEAQKSLRQLKKLQLQGIAPERVLGKVAYEARRLVQAKYFLQQKRPLTSLTDGSSWKEKKLRANMRLFPYDRAKEVFLLLSNSDLRLKTTNEPPFALLEELFLRLSALLQVRG